MNKLRVGVLMGGRSIENEVSFNSGRTICDHLDTSKYDIIPLFQDVIGKLYILPWRFLHRGKIADFEWRLPQEATTVIWDDLKTLVDFVYIAVHGKFAEDGRLQGMLEVLQIPYLGSKVAASALGMNKDMQKKILAAAQIPVPSHFTITKEDILLNSYYDIVVKKINDTFGFPCVVKPIAEGSSLGMSVVKKPEDVALAIQKACFISQLPQDVLLEKYIHGMEFTCIVITDEQTGKLIPLTPTEIVKEANTDFFDYHQKYMPGRATKFTPARCSADLLQSMQKISCKVVETLGMQTIGRIDGIVDADEVIYITDPNTLAGMSPSSFLFMQAAQHNMSHTQFINHLIATELKRYDMLKETPIHNTSSEKKKLRVGVIFGGKSNEKETSLDSGRNVFYKLSPEKYSPTALFLHTDLKLYEIGQSLLVRNSTKEIALQLAPEKHIPWGCLKNTIDFAFIALHGGEGENGSLQGALEMLDIPYNGSSVLASSLCMDKHHTNDFLKAQGFLVPSNYLLKKDDWQKNNTHMLAEIKRNLSYPLIAKPHDDGCSVMVSKITCDEELITACDTIFLSDKQCVLIEEYISGMELTVGVVGNHNPTALPPTKTVTQGDILTIEEKFLPGAGENQTPAPLEKSALEYVQRTVEAIYSSLGCKGYARIDCFYRRTDMEEQVIFIECNTLPALTPATCIFHQAAELGIKPMDFIDMIIQLGLEAHTPPESLEIKPTHATLEKRA